MIKAHNIHLKSRPLNDCALRKFILQPKIRSACAESHESIVTIIRRIDVTIYGIRVRVRVHGSLEMIETI